MVIAKKDFHQSASLHYSFKFVSVICIFKITKKPPQTDEWTMRLCPNSFFFNQDIFNSANCGMALVIGFYELWSKYIVSAVKQWRRCAMYTQLMQNVKQCSGAVLHLHILCTGLAQICNVHRANANVAVAFRWIGQKIQTSQSQR